MATVTASEPTVRWFMVIPLPEGTDPSELLADHPTAWLLDTHTGSMHSASGWPAKPARAAEAA